MTNKIRLILKRAWAYIPTSLPTGMTEYTAWLDSIVELCGPIADTASMKWVISNEVMRAAPGQDKVPKIVFVKLLRKYAANQLAGATVMAIKAEQEKMRSEEIKKQAEATPVSAGETSGQSKEA